MLIDLATAKGLIGGREQSVSICVVDYQVICHCYYCYIITENVYIPVAVNRTDMESEGHFVLYLYITEQQICL